MGLCSGVLDSRRKNRGANRMGAARAGCSNLSMEKKEEPRRPIGRGKQNTSWIKKQEEDK